MTSLSYHPDTWDRFGPTLGDLLTLRAQTHGDRVFIRLLGDGDHETPISFQSLYGGARRVAAALQARGVKRGDRILLVMPTGREFLDILFGTMLAGAVIVPCYPPMRSKGIVDYQHRLARLMKSADPALVVTFRQVRMVVEAAAYEAGCACVTVEPSALEGDPDTFTAPQLDGDDLALVQFSSGSTGTPRGVMLTHRHLLANIASALAKLPVHEDFVSISWLPLYHDMGLIGCLLVPLYAACVVVLMSPQSFLFDPKRWLWAFHRYRGNGSTAPNFAYQLLATRMSDAELEGLDLSSWQVALCGAEPVLPGTLEAFAKRFAPYGFNAKALTPVYGLAEVALAAVFPEVGQGARYDAIDPHVLAADGVARPFQGEEAACDVLPMRIASVGQPLPGFAMRIMGTEGTLAAERQVGEIELQGPSVMRGYLKNPEATAGAFDDTWLRTGDLGYIAGGELYIVGRKKDIIIKGGKKYVPQDLESHAEQVNGVRKGCVVAFGVPDAVTGTEAVVVVAETRQPEAGHEALGRQIANAVQEAMGLRPDHVRLVPPGAVPKTSSGKLQRSHSRDLWLAGDWQAPEDPNLVHKAKLVGLAIAQRVITLGAKPRTSGHV
jgi:acyl-CoA synthetase (AMP-forming)/AMP-acid ligase II